MTSYHLYNINDPNKIAEFKQHAQARIEHFINTGSKSGVKYWKQRLDSIQSKKVC